MNTPNLGDRPAFPTTLYAHTGLTIRQLAELLVTVGLSAAGTIQGNGHLAIAGTIERAQSVANELLKAWEGRELMRPRKGGGA